MIAVMDYFGRFSVIDMPDQGVRNNAEELLKRVNAMLADIDLPEAREPKVTSGWRPAWHNATVPNAALKSKHITGQAIDLSDPEGALDDFLMSHPQHLIDNGLYQEHPAATKNYCHVQSVPPRSGQRCFYP